MSAPCGRPEPHRIAQANRPDQARDGRKTAGIGTWHFNLEAINNEVIGGSRMQGRAAALQCRIGNGRNPTLREVTGGGACCRQ
ncbi:hypothetical protein [Pseudofulvimonas gallinarii]|uniref:Uncharacterized protein n=1 Tax=Pseudofulvimonas gallinarii TaxID=634155 RepID=A0A4S3KTM7_9GAMM|nr:hypothetical protein [Pseudofulvimonas gallinarii]TCS97213.1 hypothetical protein EDC25_11465 [Pseudofulvimonas gallinarii]THD12515.1 hypothetical protein B1808_12315 [Pseudofulvimonas gallinarii]